jgi:hypothetical protein
LSKSEVEKGSEEATVNSAYSLITALERHGRNIESFAEKGQYDYIKATAKEMLDMLSELRGAVYFDNL